MHCTIPILTMSLCDDDDDDNDTNADDNIAGDKVDDWTKTRTEKLVSMSTHSGFSSFSRRSDVSFRNFQQDYRYVFTITSFLMFFVCGLFIGFTIGKLFADEYEKLDLDNLNGTITINEHFETIL